jgi:hypothetical protein
MTRPALLSANDEREHSLTVENPLCVRDPELFAACAEHRERCLRRLLNWHAARDLHEPHLLGDPPHYDINEMRSCVQVFDVLSRPQWTKADLDIFEGYFPWAWKGQGGLFGDCAEEARHRLRKAVEDGREEMSRRSTLTMPEPRFER